MVINGSTWNRQMDVRSRVVPMPEFARYLVVQGTGLAANLLGLFVAVEVFGLGNCSRSWLP